MAGPDRDNRQPPPGRRPEGFEVLFDRYHDAVFRQIVVMTRDYAAAEDVAQETWLRIARSLKTFEGRSGFYAWACRIASNEVKRHWRKNARPRVVSQEPGHDPRDGRITADLVHEALLKVPEKYRQALVLEIWEGWNLKEIGEALGVPEGTVKSRLHRAREKFRAAWVALGGEE